jgi:hypothetical protein
MRASMTSDMVGLSCLNEDDPKPRRRCHNAGFGALEDIRSPDRTGRKWSPVHLNIFGRRPHEEAEMWAAKRRFSRVSTGFDM